MPVRAALRHIHEEPHWHPMMPHLSLSAREGPAPGTWRYNLVRQPHLGL